MFLDCVRASKPSQTEPTHIDDLKALKLRSHYFTSNQLRVLVTSTARLTHIVEGCTVTEHQQHIVHKLLSCEVMESVAPVQLPADQRQVNGLLDDLVVVPSLLKTPTLDID